MVKYRILSLVLRPLPVRNASCQRCFAESGVSLAELLISIAISAVTLPLILNLVIEALLAQLRSNALADAEGNAKLLALRVSRGQTLVYLSANAVELDGRNIQVPDGCEFYEDSTASVYVRCRAGSSSAVSHVSETPLLTKDPCGGSDFFPIASPGLAACREAIRKPS